jgi:hypothetical protein
LPLIERDQVAFFAVEQLDNRACEWSHESPPVESILQQ